MLKKIGDNIRYILTSIFILVIASFLFYRFYTINNILGFSFLLVMISLILYYIRQRFLNTEYYEKISSP